MSSHLFFLKKIPFTIRSFFLPCLFFLTLSLAGYAQTETGSQTEITQPVQVQLVAEEQAIQPGRPFWVGVELKMADGWDTYWRNPGDSGFPTQVMWKLPEGFEAGPLMWPYPEKFETDSLVAFGYTDSVLLLTQITPPKNLSANQTVKIEADVNWLACKDACVPGDAAVSLSLPITDQMPRVNDAVAALFTNARKALPQKEEELTVQTQADQFVLNFHSSNFRDIEEMLFIPEDGEIVDYAAPQSFQASGEKITLNVKRIQPMADLSTLKGIVVVSEKGGMVKKAIQVDSVIAAPQKNAAPIQHTDGISSFSVALGLAFAGGLILNVMPCVLPVIALKIFSFVKMAREKRRVVLQHGAVFSLGVLISFWLLSGALLILRAYGEGVGWGFQLQEPVFVAILASILFLLGLSLFGVFELGTSLISLGNKTQGGTSPLRSSFMSGVLATLVATPCTGPLLGPALGFAMTLPPVQALAIFSMMGIGMAFPYLLFSAFPKLVRFLPKPGNWMIAFKQLMGFLMMATVVWLIWVFGAQTDNMATFVLLGSFLVMAIGAWIFGKWGAPTRRRVTRFIATAIAALVLFTGGSAALLTAKNHREVILPAGEAGIRLVAEHGWELYSPQRVEELRKSGTPVFVDFTAKWCLICQANKVTLHSSEMQKAFQEKRVVTMIADWTKKDPVITQELEHLGRTGVPVYVLYPGDMEQRPLILPQTLTGKIVREYLNKLEAPHTTVYVD